MAAQLQLLKMQQSRQPLSPSKRPKTKEEVQKEKERRQKIQKWQAQLDKMLEYTKTEPFQTVSSEHEDEDLDHFCQNSLAVIQEANKYTLYVPAYVRCHFRNMTQMDIQNLSCRFVATMNITFYLGSYSVKSKDKESTKEFADTLEGLLKDKLKVTFQNDFVLNIGEDMSTNVSDSDRTIRSHQSEYEFSGTTRIYTNFIVTRQFKFGLRSDILFFPLEQNDLDLVTTLNSIKVDLPANRQLVVRFNCMNIELPKDGLLDSETGWLKFQEENAHLLIEGQQNDKKHKLLRGKVDNSQLVHVIHDLYMQEKDGKQLTPDILRDQFQASKYNPFFRNVKISFPLRSKATEFGYYNLIENQIEIHYTREKQYRLDENTYERLKNCLFCRKKILNYKEYPDNGHDDRSEHKNGYSLLSDAEDRSQEDSYCNAIMRIPMLKASLGTIIQLCIPIFFLSFLGLVEFLYSQSTSDDQVRGQKIGSSTLIVATYISFIYAMRTVIPPTPSWSIFEVAVCILAASSLLPIIESIYTTNYQKIENPFLTGNGLFIAAFIINAALCFLIIVMLIIIKIYTNLVTNRANLNNVDMSDLLANFTKKYFFTWRNAHCYDFMRNKMKTTKDKKQNKIVRYERWALADRKQDEKVEKVEKVGKKPRMEMQK